jgi:hypothetical protein
MNLDIQQTNIMVGVAGEPPGFLEQAVPVKRRLYVVLVRNLGPETLGDDLILGFEIELDLHVVGVAEENLPGLRGRARPCW